MKWKLLFKKQNKNPKPNKWNDVLAWDGTISGGFRRVKLCGELQTYSIFGEDISWVKWKETILVS